MENKKLESINLTEKDFELIQEALENLPSKSLPSEMMGFILGSFMAGDDPVKREEMKREEIKQRQKSDQSRKMVIEEVRILQGKLLQLQRFLRSNDLLKNANDILNA